MNYDDAIKYIYSFKDWERGARYKIDLTAFRQFIDRIGAPHSKINHPILIAGTKGKGSTANILASICQQVGKTGLYTSPHLVDVRERIKINGSPIPKNIFVQIVESLQPFIPPDISTFELLTAIGFVYFAQEKTEFSVFEVGIGGRLDATNILEPEIAVITPISLDHTEILGTTLTAIATEKCGILRNNSKVVSAPQETEIIELIKSICIDKHSTIKIVGVDLFCEEVRCDQSETIFNIDENTYFLPLLGRHQIINALTAICTAQVCNIPTNKIIKGVARAKSPGRLEIIAKNPWIILDGAHNVASSWVIRRTIVELFNFNHLFLVFGALKDKDIQGMIEVLAPITDYAIITPVNSNRSANPHEIADILKRSEVKKTKIVDNATEGIKEAKKLASPNDIILATGSLYL
ncbi:MAG: bifunctional folylpolyglutamate synthase/dihydrofolate synthase, partial [Candidatus Stahlbacteria bacterium]|nr:bifunctional folylpolyglutamate synthase/dihydrofolate synthase [Candidatus Stahlbacteria bacterium]